MPLTPGARLGSYEVAGALGVGGMGEVYRAVDTKLGRTVAIKILPPDVTGNPERLTRFRREGRLLASLNHPNIGAIYGIEDMGGIDALVLEFVDGETLADRLRRTQRQHSNTGLGHADVVAIARQIADALEAAHERGIVHRDLKPANVMITPSGTVKVLDFGLARVDLPDDNDLNDARSTMTFEGTRAGVVMGTAAYMSPEQARGSAADKRTDVWAFGCVLYEMLSGRPVFTGPSVADILASVLEREPDWGALPGSTPSHLRRLLQRCLEKDARQRLRDVGEARIALATGDPEETATTARADGRWSRRSILAAALAAGVVASVAGAAGYLLRRDSRPAPTATATFSVPPPPGGAFVRTVPNMFLTFSPDGSTLAFVASRPGEGPRIWLRAIGSVEARPLAGTEGAWSPFWSHDGRLLAFFADGKLKRIDVAGGAPVPICAVQDYGRLHGTWGSAGMILYGSSDGATIFRVPAAGGTPEAVVTRNRENGEARTNWPLFLPDGKRFFYSTRKRDGSGALTLVRVDGSRHTVMSAISNVQWVDPDYVLLVQDGVLVGQRFDLSTERMVGEPFSIAEPVDYHYTVARALFTASRTGSVAFHSYNDQTQMVWRNRHGGDVGTIGKPDGVDMLRISPAGNAIVFQRMAPGSGAWDLWTMDLERNVENRLTSDRGSEVTPVWTRDGRSLVYAADRGGPPHLYRRDLASGVDVEVTAAAAQQVALDVSVTGTVLFGERAGALGNFDLFLLPPASPAAITPLIRSSFNKTDARFSSNGAAVSYVSNETGRLEVHVVAISAPGASVRVSVDGGRLPRWSSDGRELFYLASDGRLIAVSMQISPTITIGKMTTLFSLPPDQTWLDMDVAPDGRFLTIVPVVRPNEMPLTVSLNAVVGRAPAR